jgi:hypothetical protein
MINVSGNGYANYPDLVVTYCIYVNMHDYYVSIKIFLKNGGTNSCLFTSWLSSLTQSHRKFTAAIHILEHYYEWKNEKSEWHLVDW